MNNLQVFNYNGKQVRTVEVDGETLWVLLDVCKVLELSNSSNVAANLDDDEVHLTYITDNWGIRQRMVIISESGLYNVILRSDNPEAKPFRKWVTSEVLPSIRKQGRYAPDELLADPDLAIAAFKALKEERAKHAELLTALAVKNQQISELNPKASYYDVILNCEDSVSTAEIADDYGVSTKWLNKYLCRKGVQFKQNGMWWLHQRHAGKGYATTGHYKVRDDKGGIRVKWSISWTQKGRLFIYDLLKADGILPIMEQDG